MTKMNANDPTENIPIFPLKFQYTDPLLDISRFDRANKAELEKIFFSIEQPENSIPALYEIPIKELSINDLTVFEQSEASQVEPTIGPNEKDLLLNSAYDTDHNTLIGFDDGNTLIRKSYTVRKRDVVSALSYRDMINFFLLLRNNIKGTEELYNFLKINFNLFGSKIADDISRHGFYYSLVPAYLINNIIEIHATGSCAVCNKDVKISFANDATANGIESWVEMDSGNVITFTYNSPNKATFGSRGLCSVQHGKGRLWYLTCALCTPDFDPKLEPTTFSKRADFISHAQDRVVKITSISFEVTDRGLEFLSNQIRPLLRNEDLKQFLSAIFSEYSKSHDRLNGLFI